jgi:nucleoside-diphosphate-sugar epimerase
MPKSRSTALTVAVTGPTGTFGQALLPLLEAEPAVAEVVGIARRPFDPGEHGFTKVTYRQGDVRDEDALLDAFAGADVVVHLAFLITGADGLETARAINVDGTLNAFRAAAASGAKRFVYASSVAAYGFHPDNPVGMTEDWPTRPAAHLFYGQEKAELEALIAAEAVAHHGVDVYLLRPPVVLGPHAVGAKSRLAEQVLPLVQRAAGVARSLPVPLPLPAPTLPLQFVHEDDVATALVRCILGAGPPGAYNIAGDGVVTTADLVRELGLQPLPFPDALVRAVAGTVAALPLPSFVPPVAGWAEAVTHPAIVDTTKARELLGWTPRFTSLDAVRATLTPPA